MKSSGDRVVVASRCRRRPMAQRGARLEEPNISISTLKVSKNNHALFCSTCGEWFFFDMMRLNQCSLQVKKSIGQ
jgi:hypothetical protein